MCHRSCTFDRVMWPIKPVEVEFPTSLELYKWFARFFLEGKVCSFLQKYENVLLASPSTMLKSWAKYKSIRKLFFKLHYSINIKKASYLRY